MNTKTLWSRYQYLAPIERLGLALDSLNRDDEEELEALVRSCPISTYRLQDQAFWQLHDKSKMVAYMFTIFWLRLEHEVETARFQQSELSRVLSIFDCIFALTLPPPNTLSATNHPTRQEFEKTLKPGYDMLQKFKDEERRGSAKMKGLYAGLLRFCQMSHLKAGSTHGLGLTRMGKNEEVYGNS